MHLDTFLPPHERLAAEIAETLGGTDCPRLVVVTGPADELSAEVDALCARHERAGTGSGLKVVNLAMAEPAPNFHVADHLPQLAALRDKPGSLVVVKEAQRLSADAMATVETALRQLTAAVTCVCTVALPLPPQLRTVFPAAFARLRREGLARQVTLRPSTPSQLEAVVSALLRARPEPALLGRLWELTRGWPAAVRTLVDTYHQTDFLRIVDRHAYLTGHSAPLLPDTHEMMLSIRRMGADVFAAAKAMAVLGPLGAAAPCLVAQAVDVTEEAAVGLLDHLVQAGVLRRGRPGSRWRFRLPVTASALNAALGPFERRRLAQLAISALWQGEAQCADPGYLPDQLVIAGRMIDPERARQELLSSAGQAALNAPERSLPWLRAAAELTDDRSERVQILLTHAQTSLVHGMAHLGVASSDTVLRRYSEEIPDRQLLSVCFLHLSSMHEARDLDPLERIARGELWPYPGNRLERTVGRAFALSLLGRWQQTHDLIESARRDEEGDQVEPFIHAISPVTNLWLGVPDEFDEDVASMPERLADGRTTVGELRSHVGALLTLGELRRAEKLLDATRQLPYQLGIPSQMAMAVYRGDARTALELARKNVATSSTNGCDAYQTMMFQLAAVLQLCRGKLSRSRELVTIAQDRQPVLPHLLAVPEALYELQFGELDRARSVLLAALAEADENGVVAQTDNLWTYLADIANTGVGAEQLPVYLQRVEKIAANIGTGRAEINRLCVHALVHGDKTAAEAAIALVRERGQPLEQAVTIERLIRYGIADPALLSEVYVHFGELDALMARANTRALMRVHNVPVPGRQATVAENERLLAVLMVDGLGNRQIATVLGTSEKSVEGRLSRLFARAGYRSRVELATAVLTGQFQP